MAAEACVIVEGVLKADGTLELESRPALPAGPVRVRLESIPPAKPRITSDYALHDEGMIDPWIELPLPAMATVVRPKRGKLPLPDPIQIPDDES